METKLLDGKKLAQEFLDKLKVKVEQLPIAPTLLCFQIGNDPASTQYLALKKRRASEVGIKVIVEELPLLGELQTKNLMDNIIEHHRLHLTGCMLQLPLPTGYSPERVLSVIPPELDVDGLLLEKSPYHTAVSEAVIGIMKKFSLGNQNEEILIIGDSPYVGRSIFTALTQYKFKNIRSITEKTQNYGAQLKKAAIIISCVGKPHLFSANDVKEGAIVIDVGTSKDKSGKIVGDFDMTKARNHLAAYTPVPGGVGPMTVAVLLKHTYDAAVTIVREES